MRLEGRTTDMRESDRTAFSGAGARTACFLVLAAAALAGCNPAGVGIPVVPGAPPAAQGPQAPNAEVSEVIGSGPIKLALIAPLTQASGPSNVGAALRNAAALAYADSGSNDVSILVKDDHSSAQGAAAAAQAAIGEGAEIILGPVFAPNVREATRVARAAGKPVIAFSTDSSAASRGSYLLSFLVENYVERIVDFAAQRGKKSAAALVPESDYGQIALGAFQQSAANHGLRVVTIERYKPGASGEAVKRVGAVAEQIDLLFVPESAEGMIAVAHELAAANLAGPRVQIIGTGLWNDPRALKNQALQGAWFSAPDNSGFNAFAARYRAKFNVDPPRIATQAYDAVSLSIALAKSQGSQRFAENALTNPSGFNGADGVFRFRSDGTSDRGLSVLEIVGGQARVLSPAPRTLGNGA